MTSRHVAIVPHTHWDREWYEPYQSFRMKLVELLDTLIPLMEDDPSYARFMLDGQMAVVDDYLEVRPENEARLRALTASGRISVGPWYILMDEFLVSGETIVRDLEMGLERGADFGGVMEVGYLPDMFGHVAQMPQILRLAGFDDAVLWRGVGSAVTKSGFFWEGPDGSVVRTELLPVGYGNGAALPEDPTALVRRVSDHIEEVRPYLFDELLLMNGSDHLHPQPFLGATVAAANAAQDDLLFEVTTLPDYLSRVPREGLEHWSGELRSGFRANVLMGVTSNRVDVKRANFLAEHEIEHRAEPLAALFLPLRDYPSRLLHLAWREMIRNSAHDSICACSVDEVVDAVLHRYSEAEQIGAGVSRRALKALAASLPDAGPTIVNLSHRRRAGVIELVITGDEVDLTSAQVLSESTGFPGEMKLDANTVRTVLGLLQGPKIENDAWIQEVTVSDEPDGLHLSLLIGPEEVPGVPIAEAKQDVYTALGARPEAMVHMKMVQPKIRRILARSGEIPGYGWAPFTPAPLSNPSSAISEGSVTLTNGLLTVAIDPDDGTFSINGVPGYGRLVDGGDLGDSYNYSPPSQDSIVDRPTSVTVEVSEEGPVRATATIVATYEIPAAVDEDSGRRTGSVPLEVRTELSLLADDGALRVVTSFMNLGRDHRLRVHLPLPSPADHSEAECAFGTVRRGLVAEGRFDELGLPTFPSRRFVRAGGLTVVHEGLNEYELVGIADGTATEIALTLVRSTGMLSRLGMKYRPLPAGPLTPVEGLQLVGRTIESRYAISLDHADPYAIAEDVLLPLESIGSRGGGSLPTSGSGLEIEGAEVSSLRRHDGNLEVRLFNPSEEEASVKIPGRSGRIVDLRRNLLREVDGAFSLRGHEIATLVLDEG
jgi:alpha-mannosidase